MRVTKIIREYIEKKARDAFPKEGEAYRKHKEFVEKYNQAVDEAEDLLQIEVERIHAEIVEKYGLSSEILSIRKQEFRNNIFNYYIRDIPYYQEAIDFEADQHKKWKEAIENIIVSLELGGGKEDLDRMLSELANQQ